MCLAINIYVVIQGSKKWQNEPSCITVGAFNQDFSKKKKEKSNSMNLSFAVGRNRVASLGCQGLLKGRQAVATSLAHPEHLLYMT